MIIQLCDVIDVQTDGERYQEIKCSNPATLRWEDTYYCEACAADMIAQGCFTRSDLKPSREKS